MNKKIKFLFGKADLGHSIVVGPTSAGLSFPQGFDSAAVTKVFPPMQNNATAFESLRLTDAEVNALKGSTDDSQTPL